METVHVNLFGGYGVGKAEVAREVSARLRAAGLTVAEAPAPCSPETKQGKLAEFHLFSALAERIKRQADWLGKADVVLCDSAPLMDVLDLPGAMRWPAIKLCREMTRNWNCVNVLVDKLHCYSGHMAGWGTAGQANLRHERIREIASAHAERLIMLRHAEAVDGIVAAVLARRQVGHAAPARAPLHRPPRIGAFAFSLA